MCVRACAHMHDSAAQTSLELLGQSNPPASASHIAEIKGQYHHTYLGLLGKFDGRLTDIFPPEIK